MARRRRPIGNGLIKVLVYVFAVIGLAASILGTYQYRQVRALYSLVNALSVAEGAEISLDLDEEGTAAGTIPPGDVPEVVEKAFGDLGVEARVRTR